MQRPTNLKVGDMFKVIERYGIFKVGEIVTLKDDDGSDNPFFWKEDKSNHWSIYFSDLEPHTKTVREAQVGDVVVGKNTGFEYMVLERGQSTVMLSRGNDFTKIGDTRIFDELEKVFTLKAAPVVDDNVVLTMSQIAEKFGVEVSKLKIAKD